MLQLQQGSRAIIAWLLCGGCAPYLEKFSVVLRAFPRHPLQAVHVLLFVLSIAIQLFAFDTGFMTTSVHLPLSRNSVAHIPLIYSEGSQNATLREMRTSHLVAGPFPMNCARVDTPAVSKDGLCLSGMINRVWGGSLLMLMISSVAPLR